MNGADAIQLALRLTDQMLLPLLEDLEDQPCAPSTEPGGNHAHWTLGHLVFSEGQMVHQMLRGLPNPADNLKPQFQGGTHPEPQAAGYPDYADLLDRYRALRDETRQLLETMSPEELDEPIPGLPEEYRAYFPNKAACLMLTAIHGLFHAGQLADARRRLGRNKLIA